MSETKQEYKTEFDRAREELRRTMERRTPLHNARIAIRRALDYIRQQPRTPYSISVIRALEGALTETETRQ